MAPYTLIKKPLTITEVFIRGWDMFIATFWSVVPFSLILALVSLPGHIAQQTTTKSGTLKVAGESAGVAGKGILSGAANSPSGADAANQISASVSQMSTGTAIVLGIIVMIAMLIMLFIFFGIYAALIKQLDSSVKGQKLNFIAALFAGFSKSFTILGVSIIVAIAVMIGLLLLVLPGIYVGIILFFAPFLPVVLNLGVMDSLKESARLVKGHWWRTFFSLFIVGLLIGLFQFLIGAILGVALAAGHVDVVNTTMGFSPWVAIILLLVQTVIIPLMYSFYLSILYDLQSRKELAVMTPVEKK